MTKEKTTGTAPAVRVEKFDTQAVVRVLNRILEMELAGVVRYTHYSLMVFGYNRIPIVSWLRTQANEAMAHAQQAGEWITHLGEHPSLAIGPLLETENHDIGAILRESLDHEQQTLGLYKSLLSLVEDRSIMLEEYSRAMVLAEEQHCGEVDKMLRQPGDTGTHRH
jgi:bacterioferritin